MKYDVLDYIDSVTLREMLRGKQLEPAIECILIAQCKDHSMKDKLDALSERETAFSDIELQAGIYNLRDSDSFPNSLREYIKEMRRVLKLTDIVSEKYYFQIDDEDAPYSHTFQSFADAVSYLCRMDSECNTIDRRKLNDANEWLIRYRLNADYETAAINIFFDDFDCNIEDAFAELPHEYQVGDIIKYRDNFFVLTNVNRTTKETRWLKNADYGDMSLYCFGYYPNKLHSCGGTYGHAHIPILQTDRIEPAKVPEKQKPLIALSLLLKGELKITDFLESYSNGALLDLMQYYERRPE